jgi:hypothetical protein
MKVLAGILGFAALLAFVFAMGNWGLFTREFFGTRHRAIDNKIFKESEQYNDGMIRDLENLMYDYKMADSEDKKRSIKALARHRFSVYPKDKLSFEQRDFLNN